MCQCLECYNKKVMSFSFIQKVMKASLDVCLFVTTDETITVLIPNLYYFGMTNK